jgi:TonB family protein
MSGAWVGEVLIDESGKVERVWTIREVKWKPPFPAFNQANVDAIRQWRFEPLIVEGKAVPFCMTVSATIDLQ